jgi:hypothetical protein
MSQWGVAAVAGWASRAGWSGDELHHAVAVAMAASGGADHWCYNPTSVPGVERRGLWAIRVDEVEPDEVARLFDPSAAAVIAHRLWSSAGGHWQWHPVWITGAAAQQLPLVRAVLSGTSARGPRPLPVAFSDRLAALLHQVTQVQGGLPEW